MQHIQAEVLLRAYAIGIFPMAESANSSRVRWYEPQFRGVLPIEEFRASKNLRRLYRNGPYHYRINSAFAKVLDGCANRPETWINPTIRAAYTRLFQLGHAHSVEVWAEERLVGGLYGVSLGAAFMGESMFRYQPECDKLALLHCRNHLLARGFTLWDAQFWTPHLAQFGCEEIPQQDYLARLHTALQESPRFYP